MEIDSDFHDPRAGSKRKELDGATLAELPDYLYHGSGYTVSSDVGPVPDSIVGPCKRATLVSPSQAGMAFEVSSSDFSPTSNQPSQDLSVTTIHELLTVTSLTQENINAKRNLRHGSSDIRSLEYDNPNLTGLRPLNLHGDLARWVHTSNNLWVALLRIEVSEFDLGDFSLTLSPFKNGVRALQRCIQGRVPSTLGEIFPLLLVASTLVKYWQSVDSRDLGAFVEDVFKWYYATESPKEKELFLIGVDCLSRVHNWPKDPQYPTCQSGFSKAHSTIVLTKGNSSPELLQILKKGLVVTVCAQYLIHTTYKSTNKPIPPGSASSINNHILSNIDFTFASPASSSNLSERTDGELPAAISPPQSNNGVILFFCDICGEALGSNPRDQRANLQRHKDTVCARINRFECTVDKCVQKYPRFDYLQAHVRKKHPNAQVPISGKRRRLT